MGISLTSRQAYAKIKDKLGDKQLVVYEAIQEMGTATNEQVADFLRWPINRVTGRVTELHKYGLVGIDGVGRNKSGFTAKLWSARSLNDRSLMEVADDCAS